ncbi:hypothetical protein C2845_PM11G16620 [Panicum miliaceum]|uniref:Uncharacterized protein n=1 Tax=Panicum miliaceum TaxID=4540 RepID=A0A3L6RNA1_PANMI|nr:hypothetical protein C2845_PM11G16620 [Panicum miliaceum]
MAMKARQLRAEGGGKAMGWWRLIDSIEEEQRREGGAVRGRVSRTWEYRGKNENNPLIHFDMVVIDQKGYAMYCEASLSYTPQFTDIQDMDVDQQSDAWDTTEKHSESKINDDDNKNQLEHESKKLKVQE